MARPLRIEYAGAVYHVTSRGNEKKAVFESDQDRINFLNTLQHVIPEIPRSQRYAQRPPLEKIFSPPVLKDRQKRNRKIDEAVEKYGYTQRAVADHLNMHYSYISQIVNGSRQT